MKFQSINTVYSAISIEIRAQNKKWTAYLSLAPMVIAGVRQRHHAPPAPTVGPGHWTQAFEDTPTNIHPSPSNLRNPDEIKNQRSTFELVVPFWKWNVLFFFPFGFFLFFNQALESKGWIVFFFLKCSKAWSAFVDDNLDQF